jgi:hypothetical protein
MRVDKELSLVEMLQGKARFDGERNGESTRILVNEKEKRVKFQGLREVSEKNWTSGQTCGYDEMDGQAVDGCAPALRRCPGKLPSESFLCLVNIITRSCLLHNSVRT